MSTNNLYQPVWDKFLPVIAMKLKSALKKQEPEYLVMDQLDFEKASHRKNSKYQFHLELNEGRIIRSKDTSAVGLDFARALKDNALIYSLIKDGIFIFALNNKFVLSLAPKLKAVEQVILETEKPEPEIAVDPKE